MTSPACALCAAEKVTPWHYEDELCWVADCDICDVPMVVWKRHGAEPSTVERDAMQRRLQEVAAEHVDGDTYIDAGMRRIPEHWHAHARRAADLDMTADRYAKASHKELVEFFGRKYDREDMGTIPRSEALWGWKTYSPTDILPDGKPLWPPALTGGYTDVIYWSGGTTVKCPGIRAMRFQGFDWRTLKPNRVNCKPFPPCRPVVGWGCPARCGLHSSMFLEQIQGFQPRGAVALTRSYGRVIRENNANVTGHAWRAQFLEIDTLLLAERFCSLHEPWDALAGFSERYECRTYGILNEGDEDEHGDLPATRFVKAAAELELPAVLRPREAS